jgi:hypothetical protein
VGRNLLREVAGLANGEHLNMAGLPPPVLVGGKYSNSPPRYPCNWPGCPVSKVDYNELLRHVQTAHTDRRANYLLARRGADRVRESGRLVAPIVGGPGTLPTTRLPSTRLARSVA